MKVKSTFKMRSLTSLKVFYFSFSRNDTLTNVCSIFKLTMTDNFKYTHSLNWIDIVTIANFFISLMTQEIGDYFD